MLFGAFRPPRAVAARLYQPELCQVCQRCSVRNASFSSLIRGQVPRRLGSLTKRHAAVGFTPLRYLLWLLACSLRTQPRTAGSLTFMRGSVAFMPRLKVAEAPGLPGAVLPQRCGEFDHDPECPLQVESRVVGFPKDRAQLGLDLPLQNLVLLVRHVDGVVSRHGQLAADEVDQSPVIRASTGLTGRRGRCRRSPGSPAHDGSAPPAVSRQ